MHLRFPFAISAGRAASDDADRWIRGLIEQVLFTRPGERVNRPDFGCGVSRLVFAPGSAELAAASQYLVQSELQRWLAGLAEIRSVTAEVDEATLRVTVEYRPLTSDQLATVTLVR